MHRWHTAPVVTVPFAAPLVATDLTGQGREVNSHTFIGLGLMASALVVIWLIRRLRA